MPFPTIERFVLRAETELQCEFPGDYRALTLASNGSELSTADDDWQVFPVLDDSDRKKGSRDREGCLHRSFTVAVDRRGLKV
jgi:hypothetical protein